MIRVGIIRGGNPNTFSESLETGGALLRGLDRAEYEPVDILLDSNGLFMRGLPTEFPQIPKRVDVLWNATHGFHETLQTLAQSGVPYIGQDAFPGLVSSNRRIAKGEADKIGILVPEDILIPDYRSDKGLDMDAYFREAAEFVFKQMPPPWRMMTVRGDSINEPIIAKSLPGLAAALRVFAEEPGDILVEEYIAGRKMSVLLSDKYRDEDIYAYLPIEHAETEDEKLYTSPAYLRNDEMKTLTDAAKNIFKQLGLRHYGELHFVVSPKGIYFIKADGEPVLHERGSLSKSFEPVGSTMQEFIRHTIGLVSGKR